MGFDPLYLKTLPSIGRMIGTKLADDGEDGDSEDLIDPDILRIGGNVPQFDSDRHNLLLQLPSTSRMDLYGKKFGCRRFTG